MNGNKFATAASAFVAGIVLAALVIPTLDDDAVATPVAAGGGQLSPLTGGSTAGTVAPGGSGGGSAGTPGVTRATTPSAGGGGGSVAAPSSGGGGGGGGGPAAPSGAPAPGGGGGQPVDPGVGGGGGGEAAPPPDANAPAPAFRGVTNTEVRIGVANLDSQTFGAACPRCDNGDAKHGVALDALVKAWERDGLATVNGRKIVLVQERFDVLNPEEIRSACLKLAEADVLMVLEDSYTVADCLASEFKIPVVTGYSPLSKDVLLANAPYAMSLNNTPDIIFENFPYWLEENGFLGPDAVLGLYATCDPVFQDALTFLRAGLEQRGKPLTVDQCYEATDAGAGDGVAVSQFQNAGVNTAIIPPGLTQPSGFQRAAEPQGYRPAYPTPDATLADSDALADVTYSPASHDRNLLMAQRPWEFVQRKPAVPASAHSAYCMAAYHEFNEKELDAFDDDAEVRYSLDMCGVMTVVREALVNAGRVLDDGTFIRGMYGIGGMEATLWMSVGGWGPGQPTGNQVYLTKEFRQERWPIHNNYWGGITQTRPWWVR